MLNTQQKTIVERLANDYFEKSRPGFPRGGINWKKAFEENWQAHKSLIPTGAPNEMRDVIRYASKYRQKKAGTWRKKKPEIKAFPERIASGKAIKGVNTAVVAATPLHWLERIEQDCCPNCGCDIAAAKRLLASIKL